MIEPGLSELAETELMENKMNSYGKTWHTWNSDTSDIDTDKLPLGEAMLVWSFNRDGEADSSMVQRRKDRMEIDPQEKRKESEELIPMPIPQFGVDVLKDKFSGYPFSIKGVQGKNTGSDTTHYAP